MKTTRIFGITLAILIINLLLCCTESNQNTGESVSATAATQKITPAPTGQKFQTLPDGSVVGNITVVGENIKWYAHSHNPHIQPGIILLPKVKPLVPKNEEDSATQNQPNPPLPLDLLLKDNRFYFATQTINGVESQDEFIVGISLKTNLVISKL